MENLRRVRGSKGNPFEGGVRVPAFVVDFMEAHFVEERLNEIQTLKYHEEFSHCNKCSTNKGWDCNSKEVTSAFYLVGIVALGSRVRKFVVPDHRLYPSEPLTKALG